MLAVQQPPRMGSSQPDGDPFLPFGYSVDGVQDGLLEAPDPAGAPLLSETDSKFLSSFFQDMTSDQYTMPSFGEGLNFSDAWFDLPPQFMGSSTSFGADAGLDTLQGPAASNSSHGFLPDTIDMNSVLSNNHLMQPPPPPQTQHHQQQQQQQQQQHHHQQQQQHQQHQLSHQHHYQHDHHQPQTHGPQNPHVFQHNHSDDVLNAAATLLQNGSASSPRSSGKGKEPLRKPLGPPIGHLRHQALEEFKQESRKDMHIDEHDHTFTQWMFGSKEKSPTSRSAQTTDLQWGSDANFGPVQGYVPAPNKETAETHQQVQMKCLECLEPSKSGANTRSGSPSQDSRATSYTQEQLQNAQDADAPPRKRRKSKIQKAGSIEEDEDDSSTPGSMTKKKNFKAAARGTGLPSPSSDTSGKRRKSAAAKPPRENLSEEQKRENHIRSEQKRRTLIKEGFDDLTELVPGLKNSGNISKSTMLTMAADWLEELLKGNEILAKQLRSLGQQ